MEFSIRKTNQFLDVKVTEGCTVIDLGLLNDNERKELASQFKQAADDLMEGLEA